MEETWRYDPQKEHREKHAANDQCDPTQDFTPSHSAMIPISASAIVTAVFAPSSAPSLTSFRRSFQPLIATASKTSASQM